MVGRTYAMRRRAEAVEATRERLLDTTRNLFMERLDPEAITLQEVAGGAGVSEMTVIRHFGTKAGLIEATEARERGRMLSMRRAPAGDISAAVRSLYTHYEEAGDWGLRAPALERQRAALKAKLDGARAEDRRWVA